MASAALVGAQADVCFVSGVLNVIQTAGEQTESRKKVLSSPKLRALGSQWDFKGAGLGLWLLVSARSIGRFTWSSGRDADLHSSSRRWWGVCVCLLVYLFLHRSRGSFYRVLGGYCRGTHTDTIKRVSFNPGAATDNSGSVKTCLWLDDWQEGVRSKLPRDPKLAELFPSSPSLRPFKIHQ